MAVEQSGSKSAITGQAPAKAIPQWLAGSFLLLLGQSMAVFLVVAGARFWLIGRYGSDLPFWDQWDAEGAGLYKRAFGGLLSFSDWVAPHNEHRVLFTRVVSYVLTALNGQWDARVQMVFNASFYAAVSNMVFFLFARKRSCFFGLLWSIVVAAVFSCPFGWENTLAGFQSQFYFLSAFSLAAIGLLTNGIPGTLTWIAGVVVGCCTLVTMGSGLLAPLAVLCLLLIEVIGSRGNLRVFLRSNWHAAVVCVILVVAGFALSSHVEAHEQYKSQSVVEFLESLARGLAWPWMDIPLWGLVCWSPVIVMVMRYLLWRKPLEGEQRFLLAAAMWVLLQIAATAYSRSTIMTSSRYSDTFSLGIILNSLCAYVLLQSVRAKSYMKVIVSVVLLTCLAVNGVGMYTLGFNGAASARNQTYNVEKYRTAGYIATGNYGFLSPVQKKTDIPYPDPRRLADLLMDPGIAPILPVSVRQPLMVTRDAAQSALKRVSTFTVERLSPYPWEMVWSLPTLNSLPEGSGYMFGKTSGLPFIRLLVSGAVENLYVLDVYQQKHFPMILTHDTVTGWYEIAVRCPGNICRIASSGKILFSEPKEMGLLSLAAMLIVNAAHRFCYAGIGSFIVLLLGCGVVFLKKSRASEMCEYR